MQRGFRVASPTPTPILAANKYTKLDAIPESIVITLHSAMPHAMMLRRDQRSTSQPSGSQQRNRR